MHVDNNEPLRILYQEIKQHQIKHEEEHRAKMELQAKLEQEQLQQRIDAGEFEHSGYMDGMDGELDGLDEGAQHQGFMSPDLNRDPNERRMDHRMKREQQKADLHKTALGADKIIVDGEEVDINRKTHLDAQDYMDQWRVSNNVF